MGINRLLWPLKPQTPYVVTPDGSLPIEYHNVLDPLTTLTYVAGVTERISLGTSVIDMFFQNPVVLARRFTTLDVLSDGRAIAGLGIGWSKEHLSSITTTPCASRICVTTGNKRLVISRRKNLDWIDLF